MNVLTGQVDALRKEVAELRKDTRAFKRRIWQLREQTNTLRVQNQGLEDSVEILTKEREVFQKTIQNLWQAAKKRKRTNLPTSKEVRLV
jgi:regulator of replication initiation timing